MTGNREMPSTLRLKDSEQEELRRRCIEINKVLINNDHAPMSDSELAHMVFELSLKRIKADTNGRIFIDI